MTYFARDIAAAIRKGVPTKQIIKQASASYLEELENKGEHFSQELSEYDSTLSSMDKRIAEQQKRLTEIRSMTTAQMTDVANQEYIAKRRSLRTELKTTQKKEKEFTKLKNEALRMTANKDELSSLGSYLLSEFSRASADVIRKPSADLASDLENLRPLTASEWQAKEIKIASEKIESIVTNRHEWMKFGPHLRSQIPDEGKVRTIRKFIASI